MEGASELVERLTISEPEMCSTGSQTDDQDMTEIIGEWLKNHDHLKKISELFQSYVLVYHSISVPSDFLEVSARAMAQLKRYKRSNVLYKLAKCMGTLRQDSDDSCFPMRQMPMGMVEYIADFFVSDEMHKVGKYTVFIYVCLIMSGEIPLRSPPVQKTIGNGSKQCTPTLDKSGVNFTVAHCGVLHQPHKVHWNLITPLVQKEYRR